MVAGSMFRNQVIEVEIEGGHKCRGAREITNERGQKIGKSSKTLGGIAKKAIEGL